jgi:hypothetical protein
VSTAMLSALVTDLLLEPNVFVVGRQKYAPSGWQRQIRHELWGVLIQVCDVQGREKLRILRHFSAPDVPAASPVRRRMPQCLKWPQMQRPQGNSQLRSGSRHLAIGSEFGTDRGLSLDEAVHSG